MEEESNHQIPFFDVLITKQKMNRKPLSIANTPIHPFTHSDQFIHHISNIHQKSKWASSWPFAREQTPYAQLISTKSYLANLKMYSADVMDTLSTSSPEPSTKLSTMSNQTRKPNKTGNTSFHSLCLTNQPSNYHTFGVHLRHANYIPISHQPHNPAPCFWEEETNQPSTPFRSSLQSRM